MQPLRDVDIGFRREPVTEHRRAVIANVLGKVPANYRSELIPALRAFAEAAVEIPEG
jgi:hypothetical protein